MPFELPLAIAATVVALFAGRRSTCECVCNSHVDAQIVGILREQLTRCGPEHLSTARTSGDAVATFFLGVAFGVLLCGSCALLYALIVAQRSSATSRAPDRASAAQSPQRTLERRKGLALTA